MTPEGRVKAKVTKALSKLPMVYRFMPVQNGMGAPALDYYCCVAGVFVAIETKVPGKRLTDRQRLTAGTITDAGGKVFVIRDDDDLEKMVTELEAIIAQQGLSCQPQASQSPGLINGSSFPTYRE